MSEPAPDQLFQMCLYMVACARTGLDESLEVNGLRWVEGVSRFVAAWEQMDERSDDFLAEMKAHIDEHKFRVVGSREEFADWLDELLRTFAREAKRRNLEDGSGTGDLPLTPLGA